MRGPEPNLESASSVGHTRRFVVKSSIADRTIFTFGVRLQIEIADQHVWEIVRMEAKERAASVILPRAVATLGYELFFFCLAHPLLKGQRPRFVDCASV